MGKFLIFNGFIIAALGVFLIIVFHFFPFGEYPGDIFTRIIHTRMILPDVGADFKGLAVV
ncbi:MAG: DUF2905 family protein [bacterium]